jgi:hypothetical protein
MPWTPENLTNPEFIKTQLSPLDRSNALQTMTQNLTRVQSKLEENKSALNQVQDQTNGPYSFATVRAARSAATAAAAQGDPNAAALQARYEELQAKRSELNGQADRLLGAVQSGEEAIKTSQIGISNLEAAGAVPPGTNQFAAPPGYNSTINPPADVPASQNPVATPATTTPSVENPIPLSVNPNTDPNTNVGSEPVVENATPQFVTGQNAAADAAFQEANASEQQVIDPNSDPNTNIGNDSQEQPPQPQQTISLASDPNTNIGTEGQTIENESPATINADDAIEKARLEAEAINDEIPPRTEQDIIGAYGGMQGLQGSVDRARAQKITQDAENAKTQGDWRVRLSLAPSAGYLYKAQNPGILGPLQKTDGVIFPYIPQIQVTYAAHYDPADLTHSNYKIYQYKNSSVDQLTISCDFTAQDTEEANYMLAVIHFFRSVTKMFYGQDEIPKPGTPPPLCYLSGMGDFQFDRHPLAISSFNYSLPNDVDYIRASSPTLLPGVDSSAYNDNRNSDLTPQQVRMQSGSTPLNSGATQSAPNFGKATNTQPTYVPTKISISLVAYPIVTRNDISNNFSLKEYATGKLLQGSKRSGGGIW